MNKNKKEESLHDQKNGKPSSGVKKTYYFSEKNPLEIIGVKSRAHYKNGRLHGYKDNFTIKGKYRNGTLHHEGSLVKEIWNWNYLSKRPSGLIFRRNRKNPYTGEVREYFSEPRKHQFRPSSSIREPREPASNSPVTAFENICRVFNVVNGVKEGYEETYYRSGALRTQGKYKNGELEGVFRTFANAGFSQVESYKCGNLSEKIQWLGQDGKLLYEGEFKNTLFDKLWPKEVLHFLKEDLIEKGQWFLRSLK
jgi:antitoxin component YwqK of YwqJK toxin-antitoxin module